MLDIVKKYKFIVYILKVNNMPTDFAVCFKLQYNGFISYKPMRNTTTLQIKYLRRCKLSVIA